MPRRPGRHIIPIQKKSSLEFRFVGGKLNVEPVGSKMVWASCVSKGEKPKPPTLMSRSLGSIGGVVTFQIAKPLEFPQPCSTITRQIQTREQFRQ